MANMLGHDPYHEGESESEVDERDVALETEDHSLAKILQNAMITLRQQGGNTLPMLAYNMPVTKAIRSRT